jgi:hypothetical protein
MKAKTVALILGTPNSWSLAARPGETFPCQKREVQLEIQGDPKNGYHLIQRPEGFFTADSWHATLRDALESAYELFNVRPEEWA